MAAPYVPQAPWRRTAWLATLAGAAAAAAVAGAGGHLAARVVSLVLVLPALEGLAVGVAARAAMRASAPLHPRAAFFVAAAFAAGAFAFTIALDAAALRARAERAAERSRASLGAAGVTVAPPPAKPPSWADAAAARYGFALPPPGAGALAALELALAALVAGAVARAGARDPACPRCGAWRASSPLGRAALGADAALLAELASETAPPGARLPPPDTREALIVSVSRCPHGHDGEAGALELGELRIDARRTLGFRRLAVLEASASEIASVAGRLPREGAASAPGGGTSRRPGLA